MFRNEDWACEVAPGFEVPGWYFLRLRRHALGWAALEPPELTAFWTVVQDLMGALEQAFGAPACYLMTFGEAYPHFHAVVTVPDRGHPAGVAQREHPGPAGEPRRPRRREPGARYRLVRAALAAVRIQPPPRPRTG